MNLQRVQTGWIQIQTLILPPMQKKTSSIASSNIDTDEIILSEDESILWD
nr:hypothetical protein [Entomoplasma sp. MP1]